MISMCEDERVKKLNLKGWMSRHQRFPLKRKEEWDILSYKKLLHE